MPTRATLRRSRSRRRRIQVAAASLVALGAIAGSGVAVHGAIQTQSAEAATRVLTDAGGFSPDQLEVYDAIGEARTHRAAETTIAMAEDALAAADGKVDASSLAASVASLGEYTSLDASAVASLAQRTREQIESTQSAVAAYEQAEAEAAAALAAANTPDGARATAAALASELYGWGSGEFSCLNSLWQKESGWNYQAYNASSGATGIPQSLPGSKMATAGADWETNAATQIRWGLDYIARGYGSPCSAWSHSQAVNWY
ncbi:hypothetical protein MN032_14290 [Agromyces atrinae]|uniref:aggregation-promoting factor C-terminal-like domain-containing protein n=1 Tax=Agromyces atrinae TaxID=592376 RepID=UPI001F56C768|nr:hypothetical protein [Agromyces atrinae]MCI2958865.1 hypothetical protein [Agromyces atrinae]